MLVLSRDIIRYLVLICFILFLVSQADAKTLKVDTLTPSVTDGDLTLTRNGTGDFVFTNFGTGFLKTTSGVLGSTATFDLTADVSGILPIANGGTGTSSTTFVDAATNVTGVLPIANGGTGSSSQNFVDLTANQSIAGLKTFTNLLTASSAITFDEIATPSTPASGIKVYAKTDGKLYQLDSAGSEKKVGSGGGGSAGINFVLDASFEDGTLDPDSDGGGTESYPTYTADAELYNADSNLQYFRVAYTSLSAADTYVRDSFARTGLDDKQGFFSIWIKADADDFKVCVRVDDASFAAACDSALEHTIIGDDTWRKYEIPFVFGAATVQYEIYNESYTGNVDIEIDKVYVGTIPDGYLKDAAIIGEWQSYTPTITGFGTVSNLVGKYRRIGDSIEGLVSFDSGTSTAVRPYFTLPSGLNLDQNKVDLDSVLGKYVINDSGSVVNYGVTGRVGVVFYDSDASDTNKMSITSAGNTGEFHHYNASDLAGSTDVVTLTYKMPIAEWTAASTTIVTQSTELNAETVNVVSARINGTADTVASVDHQLSNGSDWLESADVTSGAPGTYTIDISQLGLAVEPSCSATPSGSVSSNRVMGRCDATSASSITVTIRDTSGTVQDNDFDLQVFKQGADVNKSATIIGKFENINSSDLSVAEVSMSASQTGISGTTKIQFNTEVQDTNGEFDSSTNYRFTTTKAGNYKISAIVDFRSIADGEQVNAYIYKNGAEELRVFDYAGGTLQALLIESVLKLEVGDYIEIYALADGTFDVNMAYSKLSIVELPDTESIIKNLNDNNNFECQTKYLTADITADTNPVSDLGFTLVLGKKYNIFLHPVMLYQNTTSQWVSLTAISNSVNVCVARQTGVKVINDVLGSAGVSCNFTAAATSLTVSADRFTSSSVTLSSGTDDRTFVTLCELPDNTIFN